MRLELIDYSGMMPHRAHATDVGADVFSRSECVIEAGRTAKVPLGFGVKIPNGFAGFINPRSGLGSRGLNCIAAPIDPGYTGEVHAIVHNSSNEKFVVNKGTKIGQLVVTPVAFATFIWERDAEREAVRGSNGFNSTGTN